MKVKLIVEGGAMKPGPAVAQQLGPMGINLGKVIEDVNKKTLGFKGTKVPVELDVDPKTKSYDIIVFSPPMAELIKKELKLEKGSGEAGKNWVGNIAFENLLGIAKTKFSGLPTKDLKAAVKLAIGSCVSLGVLIDNKNPKEIMQEILGGKYNEEIEQEKTETNMEKKKDLESYFANIKSEQERKKKAIEDAKAAEEAAKAAAAVAAAGAPAATPAAGKIAAVKEEKKEPAKKDEKKKK